MLGSWVSSPEAEEAGHPIADHVSPTVDLVLRIFARETFGIIALVSIKWICVDQGLFQSSSSCLNDLNGPAFPSSLSRLLLLLLHQFLQF